MQRTVASKASALLILVMFILSGCVVNTVSTSSGFSGIPAGASMVLMPPDIQYFRVTASGINEPISEWTEEANREFDDAFAEFASENALALDRQPRDDWTEAAADYDRLHAAVGQTILANHYGAIKLPAKLSAFDWSLGAGVSEMVSRANAQYALFVHYRDYQAGGGRVGMAIFAAALGASIYVGHQGGFASLVDLKTGDVVWFNNIPLAQGDMRKAKGARTLTKQLFKGLPELTTTK